jgi:catechol 2,3-dioxygenase-like lactoylglutathione lyase family enzyme
VLRPFVVIRTGTKEIAVSDKKLPFLNGGIAQVAIIVEDLDAAVESYLRLFGIGPWHIYTYGKPLVKRMTYRGEPTEYRMRIALSYLGPMRIELIEPLEGDTVYRDFVEAHGYGVHHFGVLVEDVEEALAQAEAAGLVMTMDGAGFGRDGDGHYAYLDTEEQLGVTIELIERPQGRMPPERVYPPEDGEE